MSKNLRAAIEAQYEVNGVAAETLVDTICATADEIESLEADLAEHGNLIKGARGNLVRNPALEALVKHRTLLAKLLAQAFPAERESTTDKARRAARARWSK